MACTLKIFKVHLCDCICTFKRTQGTSNGVSRDEHLAFHKSFQISSLLSKGMSKGVDCLILGISFRLQMDHHSTPRQISPNFMGNHNIPVIIPNHSTNETKRIQETPQDRSLHHPPEVANCFAGAPPGTGERGGYRIPSLKLTFSHLKIDPWQKEIPSGKHHF